MGVSGPGQRVVALKTGEHTENVRGSVLFFRGQPFISGQYGSSQNFASSMLSSRITGADPLINLGVECRHSTQPPDHDWI